MALSAQAIIESPDYYPLKFEGANLLFVKMSRDSYRESIFTLPDRIVTASNQAWSIPFAEIMNLVEHQAHSQPSVTCLFQIAHCGSTLLSRALDHPSSSLVIREPFVLRQFAAAPMAISAAEVAARQRTLLVLLTLLNRSYSNDETVLLKTNVPVNYALDEILKIAPETVGILLYSKFEDYLLSIVKSEQRQLWAKHVVAELAGRICKIDGLASIDLRSLNGAQAAAILWISQIRTFENIADDTLRPLPAEIFFEKPKEAITAASEHLKINLSSDKINTIVDSDLFKHHAKNPQQLFSERQRKLDREALLMRFEGQLEETLGWCGEQSLKTSAALDENSLF